MYSGVTKFQLCAQRVLMVFALDQHRKQTNSALPVARFAIISAYTFYTLRHIANCQRRVYQVTDRQQQAWQRQYMYCMYYILLISITS